MEILCVPSLWDCLIWHDAFLLGQTCRLAKQALNRFRPTIEQRAFLFEKAYEQRCDRLRLDLFTKAIQQETEFFYSGSWLLNIEGSVSLVRSSKCLYAVRFHIPKQIEFKADITIGGLYVARYHRLPGQAGDLNDQLFNRALPLKEYGPLYHSVEICTNCPADLEFTNLDLVKPCKSCSNWQSPIAELCNHDQVYLITSKFCAVRSKIAFVDSSFFHPFDLR